MLSNISVDLKTFEEVPSPQSLQNICGLTISRDDQLMQNETFRQKTQDCPGFQLRISPDGRMLFLTQAEPYNLTFTSNGVRMHHPLGAMLREKKLEPPLSYQFVWREDLSGWLGIYDGLSEPPRQLRRRKKEC